jgi:two-component system sensor histidine kinase BaeS
MILSYLIVYIILYLGLAPQIEIHPQIKKYLVRETELIAKQITFQLGNSSKPLEDIVKEIHEKEKANLIVFNTSRSVLASFMEDRLKNTKKISKQVIQNALRNGWDFQLILPRWVLTPIISVPLKLNEEKIGILQSYYPFMKGVKTIMPQGIPEVISIIIIGGITVLLSRYLTRPIRELTSAAKEMAKGKFGRRVKIMSHDEIGQLAETFNDMSQRLEELRRSRIQLLADISHEIRSPLARILTHAEILIDWQIEEKERDQHLEAICNEVKNLDQLIGDLATLSRFEQEQFDISLTPSSLKDVISQAVSLFALQIEENGINLKQNISENIPPVMIDPKRIGQVISNLIMNALQYTSKGETIEVGLKQDNAMAEVWVRDTGQGIPEEKLPFIFERFYRGDKSRFRSTGESGLGLAIAKQFVKAHGGEIRAESKYGEGTCINFTLPIGA